jgi:hypothetical protein
MHFALPVFLQISTDAARLDLPAGTGRQVYFMKKLSSRVH